MFYLYYFDGIKMINSGEPIQVRRVDTDWDSKEVIVSNTEASVEAEFAT